ncbi:MAG: RNA 2',3'-cyclic phosphodiesterase [Kiritimatiellae bacterium]|nr:RNA 2',3'-cyclic phosphodiesterase [Kiritimatiellia bacterium]
MKADGSIRSFVALDPGQMVRIGLERAIRKMAGTGAHVTWVPGRNLHCSLVFLGNITRDELQKLCDGLDACVACIPRFTLEVSRVGTFGRPGHPRVVWAGLEQHSRLAELYNSAFQAAGMLDITLDRRPFRGHITLGRVRGAHNLDALQKCLNGMRDQSFGSMVVEQVQVYRSVLSSTGAEYTLEHSASLCMG